MRIIGLLFVSLFTSITFQASAHTTTSESISSYFGTWRVASFENASLENPSHTYVTEKMAWRQIGKRFTINNIEAILDQGLIGASQKTCSSPRYDMVSKESMTESTWQFLLPQEHVLKRAGDPFFFEVICKDELFIGIEVTEDKNLSVFYDGYFFFFIRDSSI